MRLPTRGLIGEQAGASVWNQVFAAPQFGLCWNLW